MSYITMKYEFGGKGNYIEVKIKSNDTKAQNEVINNNRAVWRRDKQDQKYLSKISLDQRNQQIPDENSDPMLKRIREEKEKQFSFGLAVLSKALETLTEKQLEVFKLVELENLSFHEIARLTNRSANTIKQHYDYALKKLRAFYASYPTLLEFFPSLKGGGAK